MREYRIIRNTEVYSNDEVRHYYTVEVKSYFFFFSKWKEYGFYRWCGTGIEYKYQVMFDSPLDGFKFKHKNEAAKFITEIIDCEENNFNFTPIITNNKTKISWVKPHTDGTFCFTYDYNKLKEDEIKEIRKMSVKLVNHTKEVV